MAGRFASLRSSSLLALAAGALLLVACGGAQTVVCEPECPNGSHCTDTGCVLDDTSVPDFAVSIDLAGCSPACSGVNAYCGPDRTCLPCLEDQHCPAGQICQKVGARTTCVPGCVDDARCAGGAGTQKCCNGRCLDTSSDASNCGGCGMVCSGPHQLGACKSGQCQPTSCESGWGDCNMSAQDGCETYLRADPKNCTACGKACALKNAIAGCNGNGTPACYIAACNWGFDDCNANEADGCETNVSSDISNCGGCGMRCALPAHAQVACVNSTCTLTKCDVGYFDCDRKGANGCEVAIGTDKNNCGACGVVCGPQQVCINGLCTCPPCNFPNAQSACVNNLCALGACNANFGNCDNNPANGCETAINNNVNHCGACGVVCAQGLVCTNGSCTCPQCNFPNGQSQCVNNQCKLTGCLMGYGDCDGNPANGCEANLNTDVANCSACGKACPMGQTCANGACTVSIHGTMQFIPAKNAVNTCAFNNSGALRYTDLGQMTWKQCTVEASKRSAMMTATNYTNPAGWYSHRNGANAMTGVWSNYRSQSINTPFACVVGWDPNVNVDPNKVPANTIVYDGQTWHYEDFGIKFYDECQALATQYGSMIITPWTIGLNADNYWVQSVHQCNTYEWITNNGSAFGNDNVGVNARSSQHLCMVGYVDN